VAGCSEAGYKNAIYLFRPGFEQSSEFGLLLCFLFCFVINEKNLKSCAEGERNRKPRVSLTRPHHLDLTETQGL
jgi:hypothetical protein